MRAGRRRRGRMEKLHRGEDVLMASFRQPGTGPLMEKSSWNLFVELEGAEDWKCGDARL